MRSERFTCLAASPAALGPPDLAIAATRAGGLGMLDGTGATAAEIAAGLAALSHPERGAKGPFALHLDRLDAECLALVAQAVAQGLDRLSLPAEVFAAHLAAGGAPPEGVALWLEVRDRARPEGLDHAAGVIAKGHEAGGVVGEESSFILAQAWAGGERPVVVRGGLSPAAAAGLAAIGIAGGIYEAGLLLLDESPLRPEMRAALARLDGTETRALGDPAGGRFLRVLCHPVWSAAEALEPLAPLEALLPCAAPDWSAPGAGVLPLGQEIGQAAAFAQAHRSVAGLWAATRAAVAAPAPTPLGTESPLGPEIGPEIGTELPLLQGPMTRVSDSAAFAAAVAKGGALPMLALAMMAPERIEALLAETAEALGEQPWGAGLLAFLPPERLEPQIAAVLAAPRPPAAVLLAGGRPEQVGRFEGAGIPAFLHLPAPKLLPHYLKAGARRFILEGRECGGHVGPLASLPLWGAGIAAVETALEAGQEAEALTLVFAGGLHDARSSALVQAMAGGLARRGVRIGLLMGSAYVFTEEIVATGAVLPQFQETLLAAEDTVSLTTGPGHASRTARTPFVDAYLAESRRLAADPEMAAEARAKTLDAMILGTLRIAAKGEARDAGGRLGAVGAAEQAERGMYMIGQVAGLRDRVTRIADLHRDVTAGAAEILAAVPAAVPATPARPADIAIVGLAARLPGAGDAERFWANILARHDAVTDVPRHRWDWRLYEGRGPDRIYGRWGGFLDDMPFDPLRWGIAPKTIPTLDPMQLMGLEVAAEALTDAGLAEIGADLRARAGVVVGISGGQGDFGQQLALRAELPRFLGDLPDDLAARLPAWSEDSFAGLLPNVVAGRIANRLDFGGINLSVDAACASALAALHQAVAELRAGRADLMIAGGLDTQQGPFSYMSFAQTGALSPTGRSRAFAAEADGIAISEGIVMLALRRLEDAEAAGDRIHAVIKGVGASSDGRARALYAPEPRGQVRAMRRAYAEAGYGPETVGLFEAHGTGTVRGDSTELESTAALLGDAPPRGAVIGSVKSNIGHTKAAAGLAGVLKATLALSRGVLPPHGPIEAPNAALATPTTPFHLPAEAEPWGPGPRRAGVSAFGFGGTNLHVTLEAYGGEYRADRRAPVAAHWPAELCLLSGESAEDLAVRAETVAGALSEELALADVAASLAAAFEAAAPIRAAYVAESIADLALTLPALAAHLRGAGPCPPGGEVGRGPAGPVALLFPGQGAQYPGMGRALGVYAPDIAEALAALPPRARRAVFPREAGAAERLAATDVAQPALAALEAGIWRFLDRLGLRPEMAAGHSFGEFAALHAAGALSFEDFLALAAERGRLMAAAAGDGGMLAIRAGEQEITSALADRPELTLANLNAPDQGVVAGPGAALDDLGREMVRLGHQARRLEVGAAFHSPLMAPAAEALADWIHALPWGRAAFPVFSNVTAAPHDAAPEALLARHLTAPVLFARQIEAMHDAGARIFLEAGPRRVLTGLVGRILGERPHHAVALDDGSGGLAACLRGLGGLLALGVPLRAGALFEGRAVRRAPLEALGGLRRDIGPPAHGWWLNGSGARPAAAPVGQIGVTLETRGEHRLGGETRSSPDIPPPLGAHSNTRSKIEGAVAMPDRPDPPPGAPVPSVSLAYFHLVAEALAEARRVALAELGADPGPLAPAAGSGIPPAAEIPAPRPLEPPVPRDVSAPAPGPAPRDTAPLSAPVAPVSGGVINGAGGDSRLGRAELARRLGAVIAERTGYGAEMLELDRPLEAGLGIDSIKRVDIVAGLLEALPAGHVEALSDTERAELSTVRTMADMLAVLDLVEARLGGSGPPVNFKPAGAAPGAGAEMPRSLHRPARFETRVVPAAPARAGDLPPGPILILPDAGGVATALAARIGAAAEVLPAAAVAAPAALEAALAGAGAARTLVHLAGLDARPLNPAATDPADWARALFRAETSLFLALRALPGLSHVLAAVPLSPAFGAPAAGAPVLVGGASGLLKTLALERPGLRVRALGLETADPDGAARIAAELAAPEGPIEIGYRAGWRLRLETVAAHGGAPAPAAVSLARVILATGGGRGITATALEALARPGVTLILVGRHPGPEAAADPSDDPRRAPGEAGPNGAPALSRDLPRTDHRAALPAEGTPGPSTGRAPDPAADEILATLARLRVRGAQAFYLSLDVTDPTAVARSLAALAERHGPIEGLVHGAGVIEDRGFARIDRASWDRVMAPKITGLLALLRHLPHETLRFVALFASVSGRYGNPGQASYAAANALLARIGHDLQGTDGPRVRVFAWGPWDGAGMVGATAASALRAQGITLIAPEAGRAAFAAELSRSEGPVEVVFGDGPWAERDVGGPAEARRGETGRGEIGRGEMGRGGGGPFLRGATEAPDGVRVTLDPGAPWLDDHRIDGKPVLPMAVALAMMAGVAESRGLAVTAVEDMRLLHGIVLGEDPCSVVIELGAATPDGLPGHLRREGARPSYTARLVTAAAPADRQRDPPLVETADTLPVEAVSGAEAYDRDLFHGPFFQALVAIDRLAAGGAEAQLRAAPASEGFDPVALDAALQMPLLWSSRRLRRVALPISIGRVVRESDAPPQRLVWRVQAAGRETVRSSAWLIAADGHVVLSVEDMRHALRPGGQG